MAATVDGAAGTRATASTSFSRLRERSFVLVFRVRAPSSHLRSRPRLAATAPDPTIGTREHHGSPTPGLRDPDRLRCALSLPFFFSRESPSFGSHDTEPYRRGTRRDRSRRWFAHSNSDPPAISLSSLFWLDVCDWEKCESLMLFGM